MTILMAMLIAALLTGTQHPYLGPSIVIVFGAVLCFFGFKQYCEYRILADVPKACVRSMPMGLVHLQGKAKGDDRLTSPLTGVPCFYYTLKIEQWVSTEKESDWENYGDERDERQFYLDDGTGRVLVDPHQGLFALRCTFAGEVGAGSHHTLEVDSSLGVPCPTEKQVLACVGGHNTRMVAALEKAANTPKGQAQWRAYKAAEKALGVAQEGKSPRTAAVTGIYRVAEHCLLADRECIIFGTCTENPTPKGDMDRHLIRKGQNEKTFLISSGGEMQSRKTLRRNAFTLLLLGAALIIAAAALALDGAGML
jgi:hypothetical protein